MRIERVFTGPSGEVVPPEKAIRCIQTKIDDKGNVIERSYFYVKTEKTEKGIGKVVGALKEKK